MEPQAGREIAIRLSPRNKVLAARSASLSLCDPPVAACVAPGCERAATIIHAGKTLCGLHALAALEQAGSGPRISHISAKNASS